MDLENVTIHTRANIRFGGGVIAYNCVLPSGDIATLGVMMPGTHHGFFLHNMTFEIIEGVVEVTVEGSMSSKKYATGDHITLEANRAITATVIDIPCQYVGKILPINSF